MKERITGKFLCFSNYANVFSFFLGVSNVSFRSLFSLSGVIFLDDESACCVLREGLKSGGSPGRVKESGND